MKCLYYIAVFSLTYNTIHGMAEMAVLMGAQQGATIANQGITEMFTDMAQSIQKEQSNISNTLKDFINSIVAAQTTNAKFLYKLFAQASKNINLNENNQSNVSSIMQQYIFKMVSLHKPTNYYLLTNAIKLDQAFNRATMFTPSGPIWKNVFAIGNWEYDHLSDSFWQLSKESISHKSSDSSVQFQTMYNTIFTEYFAYKNSYQIQCDITLYNIEYPFFVGIMFNKNRWISGSLDSITKCRLAGIYGTSENNVGVYVTEQHNKRTISTKSVSTSKNQPSYPLDQIIDQTIKPYITLDKNLFINLNANPPTFTFLIKTSAKNIQIKVWQKGTKEPKEFQTIPSKNQALFIYHNIGFMSPGAIAEFKLIQPADLLFSSQAKITHTQEVNALLQQPSKKPSTKPKTKLPKK